MLKKNEQAVICLLMYISLNYINTLISTRYFAGMPGRLTLR